MIDDDWQTLFEPKSKSDWLQKIEADAKGEFSQDLLVHSFGPGIHMHAVQTREDLNGLPHLNKSSVYNSLKWGHSQRWAIGTPALLSNKVDETVKQLQDASRGPAEQVLLEANDGEGSLSEEHIQELFSQWNAPDLPLHIRLTPRLVHFIRTQYGHVLASGSSFEAQRIDPTDPNHPLQELNQAELSLFEQVPVARSVSCYIPDDSTDEANSLGDTLAALDRYISRSEDKTKALTSLLSRIQFILDCGSNFYAEIARHRALRYLTTRFVNEHAPNYTSHLEIPIIAELRTGEDSALTVADRLLLNTTMAMSAIIGGCTVLIVKPPLVLSQKDRAEIIRLTTNLQLMLRHESHLDQVIDPAAGSYYIEVLTHQFIQSAWEYYEQKR